MKKSVQIKLMCRARQTGDLTVEVIEGSYDVVNGASAGSLGGLVLGPGGQGRTGI